MVHVIFDRPNSKLKVFDLSSLRYTFDASGSAWGDGGPNAPYGHDCQISPGHYKLTRVEEFNPPVRSEGAGQIYVDDLQDRDIQLLIANEKATRLNGLLSVGAIVLPIGGLATYNRSEVMVHGGGSNLGFPACFAPMQLLCKTYGCTRVHNADLLTLMNYLLPQLKSGRMAVYSVIGDSPALSR